MKVLGKMLKIVGATMVLTGLLGGIVGSFDYVIVIKGAELPLMDWPVAFICMGIGAVLFLLGYLVTKKYGDIDAPATESGQPKLDMSDLSFVVNALKKTRKRNLFLGIFLGLFGVAMIVIPLTVNEGMGVTIGLMIFGMICLLIGLFGFAQYSKLRNIEESEIYKLIMYTPQKITGLNIQVVTSGYGKVGQAINAHIVVDKKQKAVLSVNETDLELLRQYLLKHNPDLAVDKKVQQV